MSPHQKGGSAGPGIEKTSREYNIEPTRTNPVPTMKTAAAIITLVEYRLPKGSRPRTSNVIPMRQNRIPTGAMIGTVDSRMPKIINNNPDSVCSTRTPLSYSIIANASDDESFLAMISSPNDV